MYTLTLDEQTYNGADLRYLYYPGDDEYVVGDFTVNLSMEECGTISFTMYKGHPYYGLVIPRVSMITFRRDGKILFNGQVHSVAMNLDGSMNVYAVDELAFLLDSVQPQRVFTASSYEYALRVLFDYHNTIMPSSKQFRVGEIVNPGEDIIITTNFEKTLDVIREEMATNQDGWRNYIRVSRVDPYVLSSNRLFDLYSFESGYPRIIDQVIRPAHNMIDYKVEYNGEALYTALIPLGARLDTEVVPGLEAKVDIKSVNDGLNYIVDEAAADKYGLIFEVVEFDDITRPSTLKSKAKSLMRYRDIIDSIYTLSVIDMSLVSSEYDAFELGKAVRVEEPGASQPAVYGIIGMTINPLDPSSDSVTLKRSY